jgi:iron complex outermembrane receptor protein
MSELIQKNDNRATIRWKLLTGASALALISTAYAANADDAKKPLIWIELGGQVEWQTGQGDVLTPPFVSNYPDSLAYTPQSPLHYEKPSLFSEGLEGKISFQPDQSDWEFSAAIRYGKTGGRKRSVTQEHYIEHKAHFTGGLSYSYKSGVFQWYPPSMGTLTQRADVFSEIQSTQKQKHLIVDFTAGKDVGLGMFGRDATSTVEAGVRFAQFVSHSSSILHARPDAIFFNYCNTYNAQYFYTQFPSHPKFCFPEDAFHTFAQTFQARRNFSGVGPTIAWNASLPIAGNPDDEALTVDWGVNAALLFGRQRASGRHQTSGHLHGGYPSVIGTSAYYTKPLKTFDRSRSVTVPNVGGMLGMSLVFPNAKVSIGYRGDFFFGAMDTGVDTRRTGVTGFYGPFASISVGIGN